MSRYIAPATISSERDLIEYYVDNAEPIDPNSPKGYSERCIHSEILKRFPDVRAVIHSHSEAVVPYSISGVPFRAAFHMAGFLGTEIPVFDIGHHYKAGDRRDMLIRNTRFGAALASQFASAGTGNTKQPTHAVVLMRGHGFTVQGPSIMDVVLRSVYTQQNASIQTTALLTRAAHFGSSSQQSSETAGSNVLLDQYERYCVVFETILLGRYLNQIVECESELDMLASSQSMVAPEWLTTLLASALAPQLQDSVRKFIGGWIMRFNFQPELSDGSVRFFRDSFLPWATQGSLFTATLRKQEGHVVCEHGERLAGYLACLLQNSVKSGIGHMEMIDALLDGLLRRQRGGFPYAAVYVLQGLGHACESTPNITLRPVHIDILTALPSSPALPEVARDYVQVRCLKLCSESSLRVPEVTPVGQDAILRWDELLAVVSKSAQISGHIAAEDAESSKSQAMETHAMSKCVSLHEQLNTAGVTPAQATTMLEDIWSDLEHLEYPKTLLMYLPALIMNGALVELASNFDELGSNITEMIRTLQGLSITRVYLYSPLVSSIRELTLSYPETDNVIPLVDFIMYYAEHLPQATLDMQLEDATARLLQDIAPAFQRFGYEHYFGERESVGIAALLDLISRLGTDCPRVARAVFDGLLQRWVEQKLPAPIVSAWKSTVQLQILLLCCEQVTPTMEIPALMQVLQDLEYILSIEALPRYRYLLSWMIARIYLKRSSVRERILNALGTKDHHSNPKYLAALMKIAVIVAKMGDSDAEFGLQLASTLVPLAASSKVIIRHEAQWQFPSLMEHATKMCWLPIASNAAFVALGEYVQGHDRFGELHPERQFDGLDPVKDHTFTDLVEGRWFGIDSAEASICTRADFIKLYNADNESVGGKASIAPSCMSLGESTTASTIKMAALAETIVPASDPKQNPASSKVGEPRALQTKGTAYLASDIESASEQQGRRRNDLIVVASLVDNPYNLGGLSRVAEIFGATEMHLQNRNVTSSKDFTNVSVSSHKHIPICQLSVPAVPAYLAAQRDQGWTIVGIEQTDRSVILGSAECRVPQKVVLVVGSEKEGISALVLSECDMLVEIPQQGVTRSLNVQTAAGIVLYEYARQHR
ncbi:hypothetical protein LTR08_000290 [Meristemomyces frigidus]|nr:hypothetical protein LTR08_000290 [Meristemomyces frigidus]